MGNRLRGAASQQVVAGAENIQVVEPVGGIVFDPSLKGWDIVERNIDSNVWRDSRTGNQVQQYRIVANDQFEFLDYQKSFKIRFRSNSLVSSIYFKDETTSELCAKYYKGNLYLQRVPLRLSDITEIPYPDVLHLYSQCFLGFAQLFDLVGYFDITQEMIVINSLGAVKVWHNKHLDRYLPAVSYHSGNERQMVLKAVRIISENTNQMSLPDRISDWIIRSDPYTFKDAWNSVEGYASRYNSIIPDSLNCVINFLGMKYVEEQQIRDDDFDPLLIGDALNQVVGNEMQQQQPFYDEYNQQHQIHVDQRPSQGYRRIISESLFPNAQNRRILRHKEFPVVPSNVVGIDPVTGRIPVSSVPVKVQTQTTEHKVVYGHPEFKNVPISMQNSNPFQSVMQKLQLSNYYQPNQPNQPKTIAEISKMRVPERDIPNYHHPQPSPHIHQNPYVTIAGVPPTTSLYTTPPLITPPPVIEPHHNRYQGRYNLSVNTNNPQNQGKTSPQIIAYMKSFKQSRNSFSNHHPNPKSYQYTQQSNYQSIRQYPVTSSTATFNINPPLPIISESLSGAVYKDVGNTSSYVNLSYKNNESVSFMSHNSVVEQVMEKKSVYVEESVRKERGGINVDEEIKRDLMRFRSSKASKSSEIR